MNMDVGMHHAKNRGNKEIPLSRILAQSCVTLPELCREGLRMIVLVSLIVLLRGFPCFHNLSHGASLYIYIHNNNYYFSWFAYKRGYALRACVFA